MKKLSLYGLIIALALLFSVNAADRVSAAAEKASFPFQGSTEEAYQDALMSLLWPNIIEAEENYYEKYFKDTPLPAPYMLKFLSIDARVGDSTMNYPSFFEVKVQAMPYFGPHLIVGVDNITFKIGVLGNVQIEKFEHVKSYALPWNYQDMIISKWPPA